MSKQQSYDLVVIGAGSGGVRAARVASSHGAKVAIVEEYRVGGTCVIRGCVPKKLLTYGAHLAEELEDAARFGWQLQATRFDWAVLRDNVQAEVSRLSGLYGETLAKYDVEVLHGRAEVTGPYGVKVGARELQAKVILVATGARPHVPNLPGSEHGMTSNEVFHLAELPRRMVIVGGGYIANEFAGIFNQLGVKVTVLNRSDRILRGYDEQITDRLLHLSAAKGIQFIFNTTIDSVVRQSTRQRGDALTLNLNTGISTECEALLFASGRVPNTAGLGLANAGVELAANGAVRVDADHRSSCPSLYAIGDVTDRVQLTPVAIREGQAFADSVFGNKPTRVDYRDIASAVFSNPPLAGVGLTETQARNQLGDVRVFSADFRPMKYVLAGRNERTLYKLVVDPDSDRIVGAHMIGPDTPELLQLMAVAVKAGLRKAQLDECIAIHPTAAEELVLMK